MPEQISPTPDQLQQAPEGTEQTPEVAQETTETPSPAVQSATEQTPDQRQPHGDASEVRNVVVAGAIGELVGIGTIVWETKAVFRTSQLGAVQRHHARQVRAQQMRVMVDESRLSSGRSSLADRRIFMNDTQQLQTLIAHPAPGLSAAEHAEKGLGNFGGFVVMPILFAAITGWAQSRIKRSL